MTEEWRDVVGFEGAYQVSDLGRVRSLDRTVDTVNGQRRQYRGRVLSPGRLPAGYLQVTLGSGPCRFVHTLLLETFKGPRPSHKHEGSHEDGDVANNTLGNLNWKTKLENNRQKAEHGTQLRGEQISQAKLSVHAVIQIRARRDRGEMLASIARDFGVSREACGRAARGATWRHV